MTDEIKIVRKKKDGEKPDEVKMIVSVVAETIIFGAIVAFFAINFCLGLYAHDMTTVKWTAFGGLGWLMFWLSMAANRHAIRLMKSQNEILDDVFETLEKVAGKKMSDKLPDGSVKSPFQIM